MPDPVVSRPPRDPWSFTWTPRRRYLLAAAWEGRIWQNRAGSYLLDKTSNVTVEFKPFVQHGIVRPPERVSAFNRVVWFADHVLGQMAAHHG